MNQTRTFLIFAWLMVAVLLWMEWNKEQAAPDAAAAQSSQAASGRATDGALPAAPVATPDPGTGPAVPSAPAAVGDPGAAPAGPSTADGTVVTVTTDVLRLEIDGGTVRQADLLRFPRTREAGSPPVRLFSTEPGSYYTAQSGWVSQANPAPTHAQGFVPETPQTAYTLADGADTLVVPFVWRGPDGVTIRRTYTVTRGSYALEVEDTVVNRGAQPWQGYVYRQLNRVPPQLDRGMTNPESFSFNGATWFSAQDGYDRRAYDDFLDDGRVEQPARGGWIAMLEHHFFSAWIPAAGDDATLSLDVDRSSGAQHNLIREVGPGLSVAPGAQAATQARLWVGPKLVDQIKAQAVPGLDRAVDYSRFSLFAVLGEGLFWVLNHLHALFGNWGWAIVGLVVLVKLALYPLSKAQYKSMAKMRKFQPRIAQLKERYGDDRQKFQTAMMELYKKEKINPVGGCLPILLQMPIFLALYWVLLESVELRHAPWMLWIQDLTAPDPWFILPVLNIAVMWATQKLSPMTGMDPMQQKMMQFMPIVFGAIMIFFPAGLVLYWVTNGALGLLQQWTLIRKYSDDTPAKA
ncbi:membrane protein insertase YidC [Luteimonas vadosa]|uniref:Membrane protein insertase YidC n=1 Tax=Luteimonas vadosa TaxID=1165507 RepID=A0ABP9DU64_9GAMM